MVSYPLAEVDKAAQERLIWQNVEIAENFKNHGNELYLQKSYKEAIKAYTEGLDAAPEDFDLRISLLNNRAASNLFLRNYGTTLKDAGVIIALCTKEQKPVPIKALFRAGKALLALERWKEARDVVERGKALATDKDRKDWETLESDVERGWKRVVERAERIRREKLGAQALNAAIDVSLSHFHVCFFPSKHHRCTWADCAPRPEA